MAQSYTISFLAADAFGAGIDLLNGVDPSNKGNENFSPRLNDTIATGQFTQDHYVTVRVEDNDTVFNDQVVAGTYQRLLDPLTIGGKTYPPGTGIHVGFRMEVRNADGSEQTVWTINVDGPIVKGSPSYVTVGVASNKPLVPGSSFKVFAGGDNAAADIPDPELLFCFAAGTLIATPSGERAVEALVPGDEVSTADGRAVPVRWMGRQTVRRAAASGRMAPVRIAAGALGAGPNGARLPRRDLVVTADHALILGGLAITAGALVDGRGIRRVTAEELPERATFYHIETEAHDVVLAEGAPAETWVDHGERARFDNYDEYLRLWGEDRRIEESPLPRITAARQLPAALRLKLELGGETAAQAAAA